MSLLIRGIDITFWVRVKHMPYVWFPRLLEKNEHKTRFVLSILSSSVAES